MTQQYLRNVQLIVADEVEMLDLSAMHIQFSITMWITATPNIAHIRVWNLSQGAWDGSGKNTAKRIEKEFAKVILNAGYEGSQPVTIFAGTIVQVRRSRETPADTYVDITAMDGDPSYSFQVAQSAIAAGSTFTDRVKLIAAQMHLNVEYGPGATAKQKQLPRGRVFYGMARDHATDLAMSVDANWQIENGTLKMIGYDGYWGTDVVELNSATGLIGYPETSQEGIQVRCLLNPRLQVGGRIRLNNSVIIHQQELQLQLENTAQNTQPWRPIISDDGVYKIFEMEHSGDTRGEEYYTSLLCLSTAQTGLPESLADKGHTGFT